jgi:predicted RNA-binding protein with PIN domain
MRYLIDGYNLMYAMGLLSKQTRREALEPARKRLLDFLRDRFGEETARVAVVFDAAGAPRQTPAEEHYRGVHVYYALVDEADDLIEELIRREKTPHDLTVVSDDRRLRDAARHRDCQTLRCLDFVEEIAFPEARAEILPTDPAAKPELPSPEETQEWMREFGDVERDPVLRKWLRQDDFGDAPAED